MPVSLVLLAAALSSAVLVACGPPESRAVKQYLRCAGQRDLPCLRRLSAPLVPRLHSWAAAHNADPLWVGKYARSVMVDADNPYGAFLPGTCAVTGLRDQLDDATKSALKSCDCALGPKRALPPAHERLATFEPHRARAQKVHPAMEILGNRTTAEAKRVTTLSLVKCTCGGRPIDALVLDLVGRDPVHRVAHVTGACGPPSPLGETVTKTESLLRGELGPPAPQPAGSSPIAADAGAARLAPELPDTPTGRQLKAVFAMLAKDAAAPTDEELKARFSPSFLAKVPPTQLRKTLERVRGEIAPFTIERLRQSSARIIAVIKSSAGKRTRVVIGTSPSSSHTIDALFLAPIADAGPPATSWDDAKARLAKQAPQVSFLAAELAPTGCTPIASLDPHKPLGIGSAFKLYVLAALARDVAEKKREWSDEIAIREAWKSLPSGVMQLEPAGKKLPLRIFAERMISISDNTATDHLLFTLGRGAVEKLVRDSGHARPELMTPFLSTREFFTLKLSTKPVDVESYLAAPPDEKRRRLRALGKVPLDRSLLAAMGWKEPVAVDRLEWFASQDDLCKLAATSLDVKGGRASPIGQILARNPGVPDDDDAFSYLGFKGGSEPGVLHVTWILQRRRDQKWLFFSASFNDSKKAIAQEAATAAAVAARQFLGK